jgi:hypothetical protein
MFGVLRGGEVASLYLRNTLLGLPVACEYARYGALGASA